LQYAKAGAEDAAFTWAFVAASLGFGSIHLFAWNSPFPTVIELVLWNICAFVTILKPTNCLPCVLLTGRERYKEFRYSSAVIGLVILLARPYLIVEAFRSLFYLDSDIHVATWTANVSHIG
jgi:hypothetical protein